MILIINAENRSLFAWELMEMHRQRKAVFVDGHGWNVPVIGDLEMDGYDGDGTTFETDSHTLAAVDAIPPAVVMELQAHYQNRAASGVGEC